MKRRTFLTLATSAVAGVARAQAPASAMRRVAALLTIDSAAGRASLAAFQQRLLQLGWADGRNIRIDLYFGGADGAATPKHVTAISRSKPDVIFAVGTVGITALMAQKVTTPIVFVQVTDPVAARVVRGVERPGANITGFANFGSTVGRDRLRLLKSVAPQTARALLVYDAAYPTPAGLIRSTEAEAQALGIELGAAGMRTEGELEAAIGALGGATNGALVVLSDPFTGANVGRIIRLAERHRLPAIYALAAFADAGGLISYGVNIPVMWQGAASYVDRILRGEKPGDLPVQEPADPEIVVNLATAKSLGLVLPSAVINRATRILQ